MATDDILTDDAPSTKVEGAPATQAPADIQKAIKDGLADYGAQQSASLNQFAKEIGQHVNAALQGAQQRVAKGTATQEDIDLTQQLLGGTQAAKSAIAGVVKEIITAELGPYLQTQVRDSYESLLDKQRERIDRQFGEGSFDEVIRAELDAVVEATPNPAAKASKDYIRTVVNGIVGDDKILPKLLERQTAARQKAAEAEREESSAPTGILDGGRRKPQKLTLSDADRQYLTRLEEQTGSKPDAKLLEQALVVRTRDGGWNIDNFPGLKNN